MLGIRNATLRGHVSWPKPLGWRTDIRDARRESDGKNEGLAGRHGGDGRTPTRRSTRIAQEAQFGRTEGDIYLSIELSIEFIHLFTLSSAGVRFGRTEAISRTDGGFKCASTMRQLTDCKRRPQRTARNGGIVRTGRVCMTAAQRGGKYIEEALDVRLAVVLEVK